jgi:hypothetical protein
LAFPANQQHKAPGVSSINNVFWRGIHMNSLPVLWCTDPMSTFETLTLDQPINPPLWTLNWHEGPHFGANAWVCLLLKKVLLV